MTRWRGLFVAFALVTSAVSCGPNVVAPSLPEPPVEARRTDQGILLLYPEPSPERLLGHAITRLKDGGWAVEPDVAPGCDVRITRTPNAVEFERETDLRETTSAGAGYASIASLEAKWGKALRASVRARNVTVLRADLAGPCGEDVIHEVFVGTGERSLSRLAEGAGRVEMGLAGARVGGGSERSGRQVDRVAWSSPQGYAFNTKRMTMQAMLDVEVELPPRIVDGLDVETTIVTDRDAFLVVYYVGADGSSAVLLPSNEDARPLARGRQRFTIPTEAQRRAGVHFRATLTDKTKAARESLVVLAFAQEGDFRLVRDALDGVPAEAGELERRLGARLENLPAARWRKRVIVYEILPR